MLVNTAYRALIVIKRFHLEHLSLSLLLLSCHHLQHVAIEQTRGFMVFTWRYEGWENI